MPNVIMGMGASETPEHIAYMGQGAEVKEEKVVEKTEEVIEKTEETAEAEKSV